VISSQSEQRVLNEAVRAPLISVAMVAYNHEKWIARAIESVVNQRTTFSFELVVGEDCSTDRTREIVLHYQQKCPHIIRVVTSERNVGAHKNNRRTIDATCGKYVAFCEGDDYWHRDDKLQKQVTYLETHPLCVLIHSNYNLFFEHSGRRRYSALMIRDDWNDTNAFEELLTGRRNVHTVTAVARRCALTSVRTNNTECYDPKYLLGDLQLWLELSRLGEVHCLPESLATHNMLSESTTHSSNPDRELRFALSVRDLVHHYIRKYPCSTECVRQAKLWTCLFALSKAWKARDREFSENLYHEYSGLRTTFSPHAWLLYRGNASPFARVVSAPVISAYLTARKLFAFWWRV
jgi:glycosyltransferase involved in cell wall biosynthesis